MGTVTSFRRVAGYARAGLGVLACLAWVLVTAKVIVLSTGGLLAAAIVSLMSAAVLGADAAGRLKAATRLQAGDAPRVYRLSGKLGAHQGTCRFELSQGATPTQALAYTSRISTVSGVTPGSGGTW